MGKTLAEGSVDRGQALLDPLERTGNELLQPVQSISDDTAFYVYEKGTI
jgi:hypothetical protein